MAPSPHLPNEPFFVPTPVPLRLFCLQFLEHHQLLALGGPTDHMQVKISPDSPPQVPWAPEPQSSRLLF